MIPSLDATGKVVIVTGGSKGLGRAMALGFAEGGADVVVASRKLGPCEAVADEVRRMGRRALAVSCHVGDWDQCSALVDATVAEFGRIDVLVNNAGIAPVPPSLLAVTDDLFDKTVGVNLKGPLRLIALSAEHMADGGSVVNISSKASLHPQPFTVVYAAAKAGLNTLTVAAATEYGPRRHPCQRHRVRNLPHRQPPRIAAVRGGAGGDGSERRPRAHRLGRRDRGHGAVPRQRRFVVPDRTAHRARRRLRDRGGNET